MRGEQGRAFAPQKITAGSPPLARGTEVIVGGAGVLHGITPACAGNSNLVIYQCHKSGDHPRLRGEQLEYCENSTRRAGSPPLARGTGGGTPNILHISGITPACAGNRCGQRICPQSARDHPRLRGEQTFSNIEQQSAEGSPPLARGTVAAAWPVPPCQRITPACAGNSSAFVFSSSACWDHPRLRGEQRHI